MGAIFLVVILFLFPGSRRAGVWQAGGSIKADQSSFQKMAASSAVFRRNVPYFRQQLVAALGNSSVVVKFICVTVFLCYFLSFNRSALDVLSVTPGYLLPPNFRVWTAFTHCFLEVHFWQVAVDIITVGLCGKLMEPLWGALEMLTFFALVNVSVAVVCVVVYIVSYMITFNTDILFNVHIHGLAGYVAAVAVSVKQIMPDHVLLHTPLGKMRNRNVPLLVLLLSILLWLLGLLESTYPCMFTAGLMSSWIYLRFLQYHSNGTRGDLAESFTFASFFPNVLQPVVAVVCNTIFQFLIKIKVCPKPVRKYDVGAPSSITISLPGTDPNDAERRRQIALRALSERLNKADQSRWPSLVDDEEESSPGKHGKTVTFASASKVSSSKDEKGNSGPAAVMSSSASTPMLTVVSTSPSNGEKESEV